MIMRKDYINSIFQKNTVFRDPLINIFFISTLLRINPILFISDKFEIEKFSYKEFTSLPQWKFHYLIPNINNNCSYFLLGVSEGKNFSSPVYLRSSRFDKYIKNYFDYYESIFQNDHILHVLLSNIEWENQNFPSHQCTWSYELIFRHFIKTIKIEKNLTQDLLLHWTYHPSYHESENTDLDLIKAYYKFTSYLIKKRREDLIKERLLYSLKLQDKLFYN